MLELPLHSPEARLAALEATGLLDALPAPAFDRVTALVRRLLGVPTSLVSLVDRDRQFFLSADGLGGPAGEARQTPLSHSFCAHVVAGEEPLQVENAPVHPVFAGHPATVDLDVIGYLGVPVRGPSGAILGSLCAITPYPRPWSDDDLRTLEELAAVVEAEVALQAAVRDAEHEAAERREAVEELQVALDAAHLGRWEIDVRTGLVRQDAPARAIHGVVSDGEPVPYPTAVDTIHPADRDEIAAAYRAVITEGAGARFSREYRVNGLDGTVRWVRAAGQVRDGAAGPRLVGVAWDVTEERAAAVALEESGRRKALLLGLLRGHRKTGDSWAMLAAAAEGLGRHLGAHRVGLYRLLDDETADFDSGPVWTDGTLPPLGGRFPVAGIGAGLAARLAAGETVAVADVAASPLTEGSQFEAIETRSQVGAPIVRSGKWTAGLYVNHAEVREWTDDEVALVRDVTDQVWDAVERAEAEAAVRASEAHLRAVLDGLSAFVAVLTPTGRLLEVNRRVVEAAGPSPDALAGTPFWDGPWWADLPDARARVRAACEAATAGASARFDTVATVDPTGPTPIDFAVRPLTDAGGAVSHLIVSAIDISDRLAATAALRQSEARLDLALQAARLGTWDWDAATGRVDYDAQWAGMLGYDAADLAPTFETWQSLVHPDDLETALAALAAHLDGTEAHFEAEFRMRAADDAWRWILSRGQVIERDDAGTPRRVVGLHLDVTDRVAVTEELERRVAARTTELRRSNAELDQFAYVASHDLKAPIRAIDSLAAWIMEDVGEALPPDSARHLELLRGRAVRMDGLLDGLLTYSRVGRKEAAPEPIDTAALVRDAVETVAPPEGFDVRIEGDFPTVVSPRAPLELVFRNLIGNAIKHHDRPDGRVVVSAAVAEDWATFTVDDDGPGIDPAYQARVFGLFQTLRPRDEVEGSGMGLSIVKKAVESRGGVVSVASSGRGAAFRFQWPLHASPPPS